MRGRLRRGGQRRFEEGYEDGGGSGSGFLFSGVLDPHTSILLRMEC